MNVTREVILDLLPVYLAGEASPATRALVEEYMEQDKELAQRIRVQWADNLAKIRPAALPPDLELRSLRRTRALLGWQRWLLALSITFTAIALTSQISFQEGRIKEFHFLMRDFPIQFGSFALLAIACWIGYYSIRRRLRTPKPLGD
jgi:predicted anti-sigma-YlaC factor YlaD